MINWKVRLKSKTFWVSAVSALLVFIYALAGLFGFALPVAQEEIMNVVVLFLALLSAVGIVNDPTTPGVKDSERALHYTEPGGGGK